MSYSIKALVENDPTLESRFWNKVEQRGPDDCWLWIGAKRAGRYGNIRVGGKYGPMVAVHRIQAVYMGIDVEGMVVMHACDTPLCVNPAHLRVGTQLDNIGDMVEKRRSWALKYNFYPNKPKKPKPRKGRSHLHGELSPNATYTSEQVAAMRRQYRECHSFRMVAESHKTSTNGARKAILGETWPGTVLGEPPVEENEKQRRNYKRRMLTDDQVREVKRLLLQGGHSAREIGAIFNVSGPLVQAIKKGRAYSWVK